VLCLGTGSFEIKYLLQNFTPMNDHVRSNSEVCNNTTKRGN